MEAGHFKDFYLVGGTALALQLGHRMSVDIDLFTNQLYGNIDRESLRDCICRLFPYVDNPDCLNEDQMVYSLYVGDSKDLEVKLDLCYDEQPVFPIVEVDGIRMLTDKDISAMKMLAITTGERRKDFWDIHELLNKYGLEDMIGWGLERYPYSLTREEVISALKNVWNIRDYTEVISLRDNYWEFVADDICEEAEKL